MLQFLRHKLKGVSTTYCFTKNYNHIKLYLLRCFDRPLWLLKAVVFHGSHHQNTTKIDKVLFSQALFDIWILDEIQEVDHYWDSSHWWIALLFWWYIHKLTKIAPLYLFLFFTYILLDECEMCRMLHIKEWVVFAFFYCSGKKFNNNLIEVYD